jgi:hypothetical protein
MVGQVLYLEAKEAGIRSTGIGCSSTIRSTKPFGTASMEWQRLPLHGGWPGRGPSPDGPDMARRLIDEHPSYPPE